ncbi:MAG: flagellar export chaperone FliS [Armatimonadota bacterium]
MGYNKGAQAYRQNAVMGASPVQLIIMLYDGAIRFMQEGKAALVNKDFETKNFKLQRAQKIVMELVSTLDIRNGGEVATNLLSLYTFVINELVEGNISDKTENIDHALKTMTDLRDSWVELEKQTKTTSEVTPHAA